MKKKFVTISLVSVLVILLGVSIAYFTTTISGKGKNVLISSKELKIVFTDTEGISADNIEPGWSTSKTFSVENRSENAYSYNIIFKDLVNTFKTYGNLQYKIESTNSGYNTNNEWIDIPKVLAQTDTPIAFNVNIGKGIKQDYTLYLRYRESGENQNIDKGKNFNGKIGIVEGTNPTLLSKLLEINTTRLTRTSFDDVLTTTNTGTLYTTQNTEDGSLVYYFAGNALNNWVKFGKCTSADYNCTVGDDLYWRIIRTNTVLEDGGIRLLYAGSGSVANQNAWFGAGAYNGNYNNPMYVGYMRGTSGSLENNRTEQTNKSTIATKVINWYTATFNNAEDNNTKDASGNLLTNYINPSAIYCNDRSVSSNYTYNTGSTTFYYGALTRLHNNKAPSYACGATAEGYGHYFESSPSIADKFTGSQTNNANDTIGNGLLGTSPAGLITADEISFAGGLHGNNSTAWYYYNAAETPSSITGSRFWWTMSPRNWNGSTLLALVFYVDGSTAPGYLRHDVVSNSGGVVRPVISLNSDLLWVRGDGSPNAPFEVELP